MVAAAGAVPWPQITSVAPRAASWTMIGTSPPGPFRCGPTTCSTNPAATAASKALPPFSSTAIPVWLASHGVEAQTPELPMDAGRVVNSGQCNGCGEGKGGEGVVDRT